MLTGESRFHISTPLEIEARSLMMGSKRVDHWTSGAVYECSEIAGSPYLKINVTIRQTLLYMKTPVLFESETKNIYCMLYMITQYLNKYFE
jgi:hypothetical protein